jgi:hypothetical protein
MTEYDKEFLQRKIKEKTDFIRTQHALPKAERDHRGIADAKDRADRMTSWLKEEPEHTHVSKSSMSKNEFKKLFNQGFGLAPAKEIMKIETLEELKKAWPHIKGKNINIDAPAEVKEEIMRLYRKEFGQMSLKGFRPR